MLCSHYATLCSHYAMLCSHYATLCSHYAMLCSHYAMLCFHYATLWGVKRSILNMNAIEWEQSVVNMNAIVRAKHSIHVKYATLYPCQQPSPPWKHSVVRAQHSIVGRSCSKDLLIGRLTILVVFFVMWNPEEWISVRASWFWSYSPGLASGIKILVKRLARILMSVQMNHDDSSVAEPNANEP